MTGEFDQAIMDGIDLRQRATGTPTFLWSVRSATVEP